MMETLTVSFEDVSFPYFYGEDCMGEIARLIAVSAPDRMFVVTDPTVAHLHAKRFCEASRRYAPTSLLLMTRAREPGKTLEELARLADCAMRDGMSRRSVVVAFGGGVPGNMGGLLAALAFRGVPLVHVPTTLIAMHDSVLSLKQAVNLGGAKNAFGTYYAPRAVYVDIAVLATLPQRHVRSGLIENVKNALAIVPEQIPTVTELLRMQRLAPADWLRLLRLSVDAKTAVMAADKHERRAALVLEYGHTIGHAIELCHADVALGDSIGHGEAIGLGMRVAARVARALGLLPDDEWDRHEALLDVAGVPFHLPEGVTAPELMDTLHRDNKRGLLVSSQDRQPMILLERLGRPHCSGDLPLFPVARQVIADALGDLDDRTWAAPPLPMERTL